MKALALLALIAACCASTPDDSPTYHVTWASQLTCDPGSVSQPCPYEVFTSLVTLNPIEDGSDRVALTWWAAPVAGDRGPIPDLEAFGPDGSILLAERGDDGGERQASALAPTASGYAGDVSWLLFCVAGITTWRVTVTR